MTDVDPTFLPGLGLEIEAFRRHPPPVQGDRKRRPSKKSNVESQISGNINQDSSLSVPASSTSSSTPSASSSIPSATSSTPALIDNDEEEDEEEDDETEGDEGDNGTVDLDFDDFHWSSN